MRYINSLWLTYLLTNTDARSVSCYYSRASSTTSYTRWLS